MKINDNMKAIAKEAILYGIKNYPVPSFVNEFEKEYKDEYLRKIRFLISKTLDLIEGYEDDRKL